MSTNYDDWVIPAKKALDWFIESIGQKEWHRRRQGVADYFHAVKDKTFTEEEIQADGFEKRFSPIAVYADWIAWYMYLVEAIFKRQGCDDPFQSARIYPFFAAIGRDIDALKKMPGIVQRLKVMFNEAQNKPDSTLFELTVALLYHRNGWDVVFLEEHPAKKTPDFVVTRNGKTFWVECKRFAKVTDFAEQERLHWQKRCKHLFNAMRLKKCGAFVDITFKVPIADTLDHILGSAFFYYVDSGMILSGSTLENDQIRFKATLLDLNLINTELSNSSVRPNSPNMIALLTDGYDIQGNYTQLVAPAQVDTVNPDDKLWVLNEFYCEVYEAYIAKWDCIADSSVDQKAKDVKKMLSKALSQIPEDGQGIIHIGYETVTGSKVELERQEKIQHAISSFNFGSKQVESIFCHALQLLPKLDGLDWAETTLFFEKNPNSILKNNLLLELPATDSSTGTHWEDDILNSD